MDVTSTQLSYIPAEPNFVIIALPNALQVSAVDADTVARRLRPQFPSGNMISVWLRCLSLSRFASAGRMQDGCTCNV
jgi:hypothetical protein